ncbi:MAG: DUF3106 domain-containing protein [Pseudomonadota bacterium]|nr:DUF3106 domain-containing protein [Pseudomonadota bacterium]
MISVLIGAVGACFNSDAAPLAPGKGQTATAIPTDTERSPTWSALSAGQQAALKPLERDWHSIGSDHKQKWLEIAAQFPVMSGDERQRIQARMTEWATLTPQQRGTVRLQFKQAQQLSPSNRQARWEAYQALPEAEKKQLASRAEPAAPDGAALRRARSTEAADRSPSGVQAKSNVVAPLDAGRPVRSVAPTLVQAPTGATTTLISKRPMPPVHEQAGLSKITASPNFVNPSTLLPQRGPQGAAVVSTGASAALARP